jgi:hypothetical protein
VRSVTKGAQRISTALNPASVLASPFCSQGIEIRDAGRLVFVAGQVGMTADGTVLQGIQAQAVQAIANLSAVLGEAGLSPADVVKVTATSPTRLIWILSRPRSWARTSSHAPPSAGIHGAHRVRSGLSGIAR